MLIVYTTCTHLKVAVIRGVDNGSKGVCIIERRGPDYRSGEPKTPSRTAITIFTHVLVGPAFAAGDSRLSKAR